MSVTAFLDAHFGAQPEAEVQAAAPDAQRDTWRGARARAGAHAQACSARLAEERRKSLARLPALKAAERARIANHAGRANRPDDSQYFGGAPLVLAR